MEEALDALPHLVFEAVLGQPLVVPGSDSRFNDWVIDWERNGLAGCGSGYDSRHGERAVIPVPATETSSTAREA